MKVDATELDNQNNPLESPMGTLNQVQPMTSNEKIKQLEDFIKMIDYENLHNDSRYSKILNRNTFKIKNTS